MFPISIFSSPVLVFSFSLNPREFLSLTCSHPSFGSAAFFFRFFDVGSFPSRGYIRPPPGKPEIFDLQLWFLQLPNRVAPHLLFMIRSLHSPSWAILFRRFRAK